MVVVVVHGWLWNEEGELDVDRGRPMGANARARAHYCRHIMRMSSFILQLSSNFGS